MHVKKCHLCGKIAHLFLTQVVQGKITELCLCENCAKNKGFFDPQSLSFAEKFFPEELKKKVEDIVKEIADISSQEDSSHLLATVTPKMDMLTQCPSCNFTIEQVRETGRMGCPHCYSVFQVSQEMSVQSIANDNQDLDDLLSYSEPFSLSDSPDTPVSLKIAKLELDLELAVSREHYELAASIRDEINKLKESQ